MANIGQERDQDTTTYAGFTGLRNNVASERLAPTDLDAAVNVDLDMSGRLSRRAGFTSLVSGTRVHSLWANEAETLCLYVANGTLYRYPGAVVVATGVGHNPMSYCQVNNMVYFSNGEDTGVYDITAGVARAWGITAPAPVGITTTAGPLTAGTYQVTTTYLTADGRESGAGLAQSITVAANAALVLTLPVSVDTQVVAKNIYVSTADGDMLYYADTVAGADTTYAYKGASLARPLDKQFLSPAPAGQLVAFYRGRLFVASGDVLYVSTEFGYELFDLRAYIPLDSKITMLAVVTDKESSDISQNSGMFIGTERSCGVLVGSAPENFQYVPKLSYGVIQGSLAMVDGSLFADGSTTARQIPLWLTQRGICAGMPGMQVQNLTRSKYDFSAAGQGASVFVHEQSRYIVNFNL